MRSRETAQRHRRIQIGLLVSFAIHLLGLLAYQRWAPGTVQEILRPVVYEPMVVQPQRFAPVPLSALPKVVMERIREEAAAPPETLAPLVHGAPEDVVLEMDLLAELGQPVPGRDAGSVAPGDVLPTLEQMQMQMVRMRSEELEQYARLWVPDADTTDQESRDRLLARQIVLAAVGAMGGMEALLEIRDMQYQGRFHKSYGTWSRYALYLPARATLIYDGHRGFVDLFGEVYPLKGEGLREVQRRAERWDFLSRYLGDGVSLRYLGTRQSVRQEATHHVVLVEDLKFGGRPFRALFDSETKLLATEEYVDRHPRFLLHRRDYGPVKRAWIWRQLEHLKLTDAGGRPVWRFAKSTYPVSYEVIDDAIFSASPADTVQGRLDTFESEATLWVEVEMMALSPRANPLLPGAPNKLYGRQMQMLKEQVEEVAVDELGRRGLFRRVEVLRRAWRVGLLPEGDMVLVVYIDPGTYQARLWEATEDLMLVQDGPPTLGYAMAHPECGWYGRPSFHSIDDEAAYMDPSRLRELFLRTSEKVRSAIRQYAARERQHFLHMRECCYCQEP